MQKKAFINSPSALVSVILLVLAALNTAFFFMCADLAQADEKVRYPFLIIGLSNALIFGLIYAIMNSHIKKNLVGTMQKEKKLAAIVAIAGAGIIVKDKEDIVQEWNLGAETILGYKPEEIIGKTSKFYSPAEQYDYIDEIKRRMRTGEHFARVEVVRKHKNGNLVDCSVSYTPIFDEKSNFTGSVAVFHDISEKKEMERKRRKTKEELQKSYENTENILQEIPAPIFVVSKNSHRILSCNAAFMFMCAAKSKEEVLDTPMDWYLEFYEEASTENTVIQKLCQNHEPGANFTCYLQKQDGNIIDIEVFSRSFIYKEQDALAIYCIDLTKQKMHEQALFQAVLAAEEASKMKSSFLANMSHEIRTPMNGIVGFAELAASADSPSKTKDYLHKIKISADGLLQIINDILDISKIEAGKMELEKIPFDLHETIKSCEMISSLKAAEKGINLSFYAEPYVEKKIIGDPTKLRQVLLNLLSNAIKFTNYGIVKFTAVVEEAAEDFVRIHFEVRDSGIGITPEHLKKIFDPFSQGDTSTTRKYGGTGLGLTITKSYIELMGGELKLESTRGIGSRFSFDLVFETIDGSALLEPIDEPSPNLLKRPIFKADVLICEDNALNQEVIMEHFFRVGIKPEIAPNGAVGVRMIKERMEEGRAFDVIFMDIHMPVMDGLEAAKILMKLGNKSPIVALTANIMQTDRQIYREYGMPFCLGKPFKAQELWACLFKYLIPVELIDIDESLPHADAVLTTGNFKNFELIDRKLGIRQIAGDEELYNRILIKFLRENKNTVQQLKDFLHTGNVKAAYRVAHTLKNSAGMIGAPMLAEAAFVVETALSGQRNNCSDEQMHSLETALGAVLAELEIFMEESGSHILHDESVNTAKALELADKLLPLLEAGNFISVEFIPALREIFAKDVKECDKLIKEIENYDFELAIETLNIIRERAEQRNAQ